MNIFDSLTRWITHPMRQQRVDLAALNIDQLVDINNYEISNSDSTIKEFINYQIVLLYTIIITREATRGQLDFNYYEQDKGVNLFELNQKKISNKCKYDSLIAFSSRKSDQKINAFINRIKHYIQVQEITYINDILLFSFDSEHAMDDLNREANFAVCYEIPYDGKGDYNSQLFEYLNYLMSTILSSANKIKEKKILIAFDFINDLKKQDKRRFFRSMIRSIMQAYYSTYNLKLGNIHIYLDSDEDRILFNSVLKELVLLLKYYSNENPNLINAHEFLNHHPYFKDKDKKEYGLIDKKVAYKMQTDKNKSSFAYDTSSLSDGLQGEIRITSESFRRDLLKIQTIKDFDTSILILGETGIGKTFLARKIHDVSNRNKEKFVEVSCTTISENLIESELFGYEKGSHNTAFEGKIGKIESADKGTLFLDEVGKASLGVQIKLLKVIEEKKFFRVGGVTPRTVDVRFIFAFNEDPSELISSGKLLPDLYYRMAHAVLKIPPLRERKEDIKNFALFFINNLEIKYQHKIELSSDALTYLLNQPWLGNIRQLESYLEDLIVECKTFPKNEISLEELQKVNSPVIKSEMKFHLKKFEESFNTFFDFWYPNRSYFFDVDISSPKEGMGKNKSIKSHSFLNSIIEPVAANYFQNCVNKKLFRQKDASEIIGLSWSGGEEDSTLTQKARVYEKMVKVFRNLEK